MQALLQEIQTSLLDIFGQAVTLLPAALLAVGILFLTRYATRFVSQLVEALARQTVSSRSLQSLFVQTSRVAVWLGGAIVAGVIAFPDLRLGDIIGLLGLGSVAIGFAFQDIFKNFLAGVLLLLEEPFQLGDQVVVNGFEGTVESIQIRSTKLHTYQGELVDIPNALIFTNPIHVLTAHSHRRTDLDIGVDYTTPLPKAKEVFLQVLGRVDGIVNIPAPEVDVVGFGGSSIDFKVRYWTLPQKIHVRRIQSEVVVQLKRACDDADITIPYPIRTLHLFDQRDFNESVPIENSSVKA
ncbi:mechanosensitive ion channel family protein [Synechococcus sp. PCC 7336]|uniref:mechanosensitive ion channel family protein n=1 Tax=Synechococcus sp. PCC 7336 TaxID=195250 RepID=UPI000347B310|nr:mechanosensitive ion channel family protein [Synechococcus sp. PCC 7336]